MSPRYCLITNDDGWHSPGLSVLKQAVKPFVPVVVAPEGERSGVGHAINLVNPLRIRKTSNTSYEYVCSGTPADCVKIGIKVIVKKRPNLVISGINIGPNLGMDVLYSGTVSAAMEGAILGFPAIAISLVGYENLFWETARKVVPVLIRLCLGGDLAADTVLNVNIPNLPPEQIRGYKITRQSQCRFEEDYEVRNDPRGCPYYWLKGNFLRKNAEKGTDVEAVLNNYVSICPLHLDLTAYALKVKLQRKLRRLI